MKKTQIIVIVITIFMAFAYMQYTTQRWPVKLLSLSDVNPFAGVEAIFQVALGRADFPLPIGFSIGLTLAICAVALIGGKFFCGFICPFGAIQDLQGKLADRWGFQGLNAAVMKTFRYVKYGILVLVLLGMIYQKLGLFLGKMGAGLFLIFFFISFIVKRGFCMIACPLGAMQTLLSAIAPIAVGKPKECSHCGVCTQNCPACLSFSKQSKAMSCECIYCMECTKMPCEFTKQQGADLMFLTRKKINRKGYLFVMMLLFVLLWIGVPKLSQWEYMNHIPPPVMEFKDGTYFGSGKGFGGEMKVTVKVKNNKMWDIQIISHKESTGWHEEAFLEVPSRMIKRQTWEVDGVSGATKTSEGIRESVKNALQDQRIK